MIQRHSEDPPEQFQIRPVKQNIRRLRSVLIGRLPFFCSQFRPLANAIRQIFRNRERRFTIALNRHCDLVDAVIIDGKLCFVLLLFVLPFTLCDIRQFQRHFRTVSDAILHRNHRHIHPRFRICPGNLRRYCPVLTLPGLSILSIYFRINP